MIDFKKSTVYQVYIKSFCDSDGDGIGDLNGIRLKLPYLKELGVDLIWVTPFFKSPMVDNGYDVADYRDVDPQFGTMADCEAMIAEADTLGMGFMFDMVFNHTSSKHEWFQKALTGDPEYMDYYIFRDGTEEQPPTDWTCSFGGPAWEYVPSLGKWYLHLFDPSQPDLNWENPRVREELKDIIRFWKEKGVKGFRFDVLNLISKPAEFTGGGPGHRYCRDGRHVHEFIREMVTDTGLESLVTVGEMASTNIRSCIGYSSPENHELSMCFNFHHLKVDYKDGSKWALMAPDYIMLRTLFRDWQEQMAAHGGWNAVFWCNHDQPRIVSRFGDEGIYHNVSGKMLGTFIYLLRGTPYIYQGEEIGMTNAHFRSIEEYRDVECLNHYEILLRGGSTKEEALEVLANRARDNGRTPMQWNGGKNAGFTEGTPWIGIPDNYREINVEAACTDPDSILHYYRRLIALRKEYDIISYGDIRFLETGISHVIAFERTWKEQTLTVICNFGAEKEEITDPELAERMTGGSVLISSVGRSELSAELLPYEATACLKA